MPKRIEFIAPVAAVRGNMSGKQKLLYAKNDNPAYDAPVGKVSYARNYRPSYIGAKLSSTGQCYYTTRTKNAVNLTTRQKTAMAVYGGTFALIGSLMAQDETTVNSYYTRYDAMINSGLFSGTFRQYLTKVISSAIKSKVETIRFNAPGVPSISFANPWVSDSWDVAIRPTKDTFVKFFDINSQNGYYFSVDGATGVATSRLSFGDIIRNDWNVLGLETGTVEQGMGNLMLNGMYVCKVNDDGDLVGVSDSDNVIEDYNYVLSAEAQPVSA